MKVYRFESVPSFGSRGGKSSFRHYLKRYVRWAFRLNRYFYPIPYFGLSKKKALRLVRKIALARFSDVDFVRCVEEDFLPF